MVQIKEIQSLLDLYITRINTVVDIFLIHFHERNPTKLWRRGLIERTGFLVVNQRLDYSFHGAGCTVEFENGEVVSFDFLEDDSFPFDLFKFQMFVLSKQYDEEEIDKLFQVIKLYKKDEQWIVKGNVPY